MVATPARFKVCLSDPGMYDRCFEADTWEEICERLGRPESQNYTLATVYCDTSVVGWGARQIGESHWKIRLSQGLRAAVE